ncbi:MAG: hypothetical protein Q7T19_04645 [Caulobacter sp.]|nr:hypothetical protein [Caulobacter sp.]
MRLFHFSEDPGIKTFVPRHVATRVERGPDREWLNGPLVWAIDEIIQPLYFFPRDCPRIVMWPKAETTQADMDLWWAGRDCRMVAHIESDWLSRLHSAVLHRYELPVDSFESLGDAGMWVSRDPVTPIAVERMVDLPAALKAEGVDLRVLNRLTSLREAWDSSLHVSGVRLRNAQDWDQPLRWP